MEIRIKKSGQIFTIISLLLLSSCSGLLGNSPEDEDANDPRPNFLIIITDDQRYDSMQYMPKTQELIFDQGVTFSRGYITTPICCPSRASIFTGLYAHNHGVLDNDMRLESNTFAYYLKESGYYTGLVGKYLNSWKEKDDIPPGFDYWVAFSGGESRYYNPRLNVNGDWLRHQDQYITYALGDYALQFLDQASEQSRPFSLVLAFNAPHTPATPARDYPGELPDITPYRPPSFNEEDVSDKTNWIAAKDLLTKSEIREIDRFRIAQILTLLPMDNMIGNVIDKLREIGELDETVIIFLSDNGKHWGEHRLSSKNTIYEESIRVPFALRYPPLVPEPYIEERLVANIDIAATIYDLAGIAAPPQVDGLSLVGLLNDSSPWRTGLLIEGWPARGIYSAIHTGRYIYAETEGDLPELYDLMNDPYQLTNLVNDPEYADILEDLKVRLEQAKE